MFASESASKQVYSKAFFHIHTPRDIDRDTDAATHYIRFLFCGSSL